MLSSNCIGLSVSRLSIILASKTLANRKNSSFLPKEDSMIGGIGSISTSSAGLSMMSVISVRMEMRILRNKLLFKCLFLFKVIGIGRY